LKPPQRFDVPRRGTPDGVKSSEVASLPIRFGAAVRDARLFHPVGVLAKGAIERVAAPLVGLPIESGDIVGRISKGVGLPGSLPDIAGLAWRMQPQASGTPWDVLLASTIANSRILLAPTTSWSGASFSSLMPLKFGGGVWWLRARMINEVHGRGLSMDDVTNQIGSGGVDFGIEQARATGGFTPLARLKFTEVDDTSGDIAFDPTLHTAPGLQLLPRWLTTFRRAAYRRSREGRAPTRRSAPRRAP
jgi:hypothetical protein